MMVVLMIFLQLHFRLVRDEKILLVLNVP